MDGLIVEKYAMSFFSVRSQALAMIGNNHDQRIVIQLAGPKRRHQFPDRSICCHDGRIVRTWRRSPGIIQVDPQEKGP